MVDILQGHLKSWLLMDNETWAAQFDYESAMVTAHNDYSVPVLFNLDVWPDFRNVRNSIISVCIFSLSIFLNNHIHYN